jgi:uncharacterized protein with HEPN domain
MRREPEDDYALLLDMLRYADTVQRLCRGRSPEEFDKDEMLRLAVERAIQIVCEAARKVSKEFRLSHAEIPWKAIIGQRHVLVHDDGEIDTAKIWRVASVHIPALIPLMEPLIPEPPQKP